MIRQEPPPLATWMLEHLASGDRDEALSGDLLEQFRAGRGGGWYWQQVLAACAVSWSNSLSARGSALLFALLWSALAPAWHAAIEGIKSPPGIEHGWSMLGPLMLLLALAAWTVLHAAFLWAGILVYQLAHMALKKPLRAAVMRRALWMAAIVLPPVAFVVFVLAALYRCSVPGLAHAKLADTSWGQIADLRIYADLIRIPYFVALLAALWGTISQPAREQRCRNADSLVDDTSTPSGEIALAALDSSAVKRFLAFMVGAGIVNAMIAGFLLCRLPDSAIASLGSLLVRALFYVAVGVSAGVLGAYAYWQSPWSPFREHPPLPFSLFALVCASGWVWVPSMVIFWEALSAGAALVAMIGAFLLVAGMRYASYLVPAPAPSGFSSPSHGGTGLFEESLYRAPINWCGYAIAACLYTAGVALATKSNFTAAALLALAAAFFAWNRAVPRSECFESRIVYKKAARRAALVLVPAVLVTAWALLGSASSRNRTAQSDASLSAGSSAPARSAANRKLKRQKIAYGTGGYESVILWPYPEKKQIIPPIQVSDPFSAPGTRRPLLIRFDGPYTYVQPPDRRPGPLAHQARGTPLNVDIQSSNASPVVMEAHQSLSVAIPIARCSEIEVGIENRDNLPGPISLALLLTSGGLTGKRSLYLGQQPIVSTESAHFSFKAQPVYETLRFPVPAAATTPSFSEITVLVLPDIEHRSIAPRIAIQQFRLFPR
ncbi:MAG: hypothetical protein WBC92_11570 [Terracidiphilus sp.]